MIRKQKTILSLLGVIFVAGILLTLPGIQPAYSFDESLLFTVFLPAFIAFIILVVIDILSSQNSIADQRVSQYFAHPTHGFAAIKALLVINNQLLEDSDFGLDAQTNDPDYGLKRIADDIQDSDFGLDAQTNDPIYGLKRIASDIQHDDWGLEVIDDEIEVIDERIDKQVSRQRVELAVIKSQSFFYVHAAESGVPVDVDFIELSIIKKGNEIPLTSDQYTITPLLTGVYQLEIHVRGSIDGILIQVMHGEPNIVQLGLGIDKEAHHFGQILVEEGVEKGSVQ